MMQALKEWAAVVRALEAGDQTVILRKGGILEAGSGFEMKPGTFLLFPTMEHQSPDHIREEFRGYLEGPGAPGTVTSLATALDEFDLEPGRGAGGLSGFHIWSDSYIRQRMQWMPQKPLKAVFVEVRKIPPAEVPPREDHAGCKSWIDVDDGVWDGRPGDPVLPRSETDARLAEFREAGGCSTTG